MDANPPGLHPPLPIQSNLSLHENPNNNVTTRYQRSQKVLGENARARRSPPRRGATDKTQQAARASPIANSKHLLPASERRSGEQNGSKMNKGLDNEDWSASAEGGFGSGRKTFYRRQCGQQWSDISKAYRST
ncbi:hypothetical protein NUW58_g3191 [Xylaria curta]|uniref:Uncharacterized protein n=1 Tax=Xylaria curta TaxID=42375 RepID=A0ACC1PEE6_9PEZI|nr:hypothetical protein NUW58_g3191 [Xylaria curta]